MVSPSDFYDLVSGRRQGIVASSLRGLLRLAEIPYSAVVRFRNRQFDAGNSRIRRVSVPVVSIGNLTLGGTGKTPMVAWLVRWFEKRDINVAIVSRGYRSKNGQPNDESRELQQQLPRTPHFQNPDRASGAQSAIDQFNVRAVLLDDGFQHRQLHRDLDIVLIDALQPFGFGHVFPRGSLREPLTGLARAQVAILTRCEMLSIQQREHIQQSFEEFAPGITWIEATHQPTQLISTLGDQQSLKLLANRRVVAFCGIGNPEGFCQTLIAANCEPVEFVDFPDHHDYSKTDIRRLERVARNSDAEILACTHKDLVKLMEWNPDICPLYAVQIELTLNHPELLEEQLAQLVISDE